MFINFNRKRRIACFIALNAAWLLLCPKVSAYSTFYVPGSYSTISSAIATASNGDTIDVTGTITESQIIIDKNLTIRGHGRANTTVINSGGSGYVFYSSVYSPSLTVVIKDMTIRGGTYGLYLRYINFVISGCDIIYNSTGGIFCYASSSSYTGSISNCNICHNGGTTGTGGAGINCSFQGPLNISNCSICYNTVGTGTWHFGGGIYFEFSCNCTVNNCDISYNQINGGTWAEGGGIYCDLNSVITVNNSLISHNVINSTASWTYGAGVQVDLRATCSLNNCTISNNTINGGVRTNGGGVYVSYGTCYINNCTIASNDIYKTVSGGWTPSGGGIYFYAGSTGSGTIKNSIIANNTAGGSTNDYAGTIISYGYNLVRQSPASAFNASGDQVGVNPQLDTLNNNGGPTRTMALAGSSPAIDAAANTDIFGTPVLYDQRNFRRYNTNDIGAFEKNNSVEQVTGNICTGFNNLAILKIMLQSVDTANVTSFTFTTNGTTAPGEIIHAKLFNTGSSGTFATTNQYGSAINSPNGTFTFYGSSYFRGNCFFWLAYDISNNPVPGHHFDGTVTQIHIDTFTYIPDVSDPAGYRPVPVIQAAFTVNDSTQCFGGNSFVFSNNSTASSGTLTYNWSFGDGNVTTAISPTKHYFMPDTFQVRLIARTNEGCADTLSRRNYVFPDPVAGFSINDSDQCLAGNLFIFLDSSRISSGTIDSFKWDFGDQNIAHTFNSQHIYQYAANFNVKLIVKSGLGCDDTAIKKAYVNASPVAAFTVNDSDQCLAGNNFRFTNRTSTGVYYRSEWYFGDGGRDTLKHPVHSYANSSIFNVMLITTTTFGCKDTFSRQVRVRPSPVPAFSVNDSIQCLAGNSFLFTNLSTGLLKYTWLFGDGSTDTAVNTSHSYLNPGTYHVYLVTNEMNGGCTDTSGHTIIINPSMVADFSVNDSNQCLTGNHFLFTNKTTGASNIRSNWRFGDGAMDTLRNPDHIYVKKGSYTVTLIVSNNAACYDTISKTMTIRSSPVAEFTVNDSTQCLSGNSFLFTNHSTVDTGTLVYGWDFGDTTTSNLQNPVHSYRYNGTYRVTLTAVSVQACSSQVSCGAYVFKDPQPVIKTADTIQCFNGNLFTFSPAVINAGSKYGWNFGDGNSDTLSTVNHHYTSAGDYKLSLTETTKEGCSGSTGKTVHVSVSPTASFSVNDTAQCLSGNLFTFRNTGTTSITACDWQFGDGKTGSGNPVDHTYTKAGTYTVTMILAVSGFCKDTSQHQVIIQNTPKTDFSVNDSQQCLGGNHFVFTNLSDATAVKFYWDYGDGNISGNKDTDHSYLNSATYTVLLIASSSENCSDSIQKTITVRPQPPAPPASSNSPVCLGDPVELYAQTTGNATYSWSSANGFKSTQQNPVITKSTRKDAGDFYVKATVDGCESEASKVSVVVNSLPVVDLGRDSNLCAGDHKILDAGEYAAYLWQDNSTGRLYDAKEPGIYYVTVTDENNCKGSDTIVFLNKCPSYLYIPNAFTPNGDSLNETFNIVISNITEFRLQVYNRWGEKVFESFDPAFQWDGKYKGTLCETGTYYFSLIYREELGGQQVITGIVTLLR